MDVSWVELMMQFNNREFATGFWLLLIFIFVLFSPSTRKTIKPLAKAFFHPKIFLTLLVMVFYILIMVKFLDWVSLWNPIDHLKLTILWAITIALGFYFSTPKAEKDPRFFKRSVMSTFSLTIVLEFVVQMYSFSLLAELLLVPVSVILGGMLVIAETNEKNAVLKRPIKWLLGVIGILVLY